MGWTISHGPNGSDLMPSYGYVGDLADQLPHILPDSDWQKISFLFNRGSGDPFTVPRRKLPEIAEILDRAASHRRMPKNEAWLATRIANAARTAANARQRWRWS